MAKLDKHGFYTTEDLLEIFKTDTTKEDYMVNAATPEVLDEIYEVYIAEQESEFGKVKPFIEEALQRVNSAITFLHETGDYESNELDRASSNLENTQRILINMVGKSK